MAYLVKFQLLFFDYMTDQIKMLYTNYKGETRVRNIIPEKVYYGSTRWHPVEQWFLRAIDCETEDQELKDFALADCDFTFEES